MEDLLGRDKVQTDLNEVGAYLSGKTVLVTGGGGSIGSELCRQIAQQKPKRLIIFDIYENNAYDIQQELKHANRIGLCRIPPADRLPRGGAQACPLDGGQPE